MDTFQDLRRNQFRRYYQPTRILLGLVPGTQPSGINIITLCFTMTCSYRPPMMAFSVRRHTLSYELLSRASECVLAVPGEALVEQTLFCGTRSGREVDKAKECAFTFGQGKRVQVPILLEAIANLEMTIEHRIDSGDHLTVLGIVKRFATNPRNGERNLLSVGPDSRGYTVLAKHGIHRIGVVER
jgi:flavin reductase (DIM6/NTAB) family NADH-FMN oxidoreductase RutF